MRPHADPSDRIDPADRAASAGGRRSTGALPDFLTVTEAARLLRIGRTSAYLLAQQWCDTGGREGLPVVRVGRQLRVPRHELERLAGGVLTAASPPRPEPPSPPRRPEPPRLVSPPANNDDTSPSAVERDRATAPKPSSRPARRRKRDTQASLFPAD
ncbi:MAG: helix-turn-helix domain-containing protein [bacterium]